MNNSSATKLVDAHLSDREVSVLREVARTLREIRYGSVVLTVHNGQMMEIQKTEKIRLPDSQLRDL